MHRTRGGLALALIALGLALLPRVASAQYFGQNKVQYRQYSWRSITSDHFEVYFYEGLDSLAMRVLDLAEKTNLMMNARMGHSLGRRVPIILYGSHDDFAQTNVTPELLGEGTGGFTEVLRNRVVLPFTGSYEDLRHVVVHELTHAYMFDMLYGGSAGALLARQTFFQVPLWFAEGMAEYMSLGMESNAEMFLRDGIIDGDLPPLEYSGGYIVYKQGQSALSYLVDRYGEERLRDVLRRIRGTHSFDRGFQRSMGMSVRKFDEQWRDWLRKRYWPQVATREEPEKYGRRLTDHRKDGSYLNSAPAISPQGDRIAYFSDRRQYTDVYLMSAFDGKVQHRVIRGERNVQFESIPSFRSSITWSPDGTRLALTAKSAGRDVIYVVRAQDGQVLRRFKIDCDGMAYPAWSPVADSLVVVAVKHGRSDLWLIGVKDGSLHRLTDDTWDEKEPAWSPDGRSIVFSSDRNVPMVLQPRRQQAGFGRYGLYSLDLESREVRLVVDTGGDDHSPAWSPDGQKLAFISDRDGAPNIYLFDRRDSSFTELTDVLGGVMSLSWSRDNDRLVFSAYNRGGLDVFAVPQPLSMDAVLARVRRQSPQSVLTPELAQQSPADTLRPPPLRGALAAAWPDTVTAPRDSALAEPDGPRPGLLGPVDTLRAEVPRTGDRAGWTVGSHPPMAPARRDTTPALVTTVPLSERGGPFAVSDSILAQTPSPYHARLSPDFAGGSVIAAPQYGFAGTTQLAFSDFLGNHSLFVATDLFGGSLEETNLLAIYNYLPRRWDFGVGVFHFKDYFSSRVTTLGEQLGNPRLFSERRYGVLGSASYPFDRFRRVEFNLTVMGDDRQFFQENVFGDLFISGKELKTITSPSVSLVGDNTLYGYYGPVNGQRYNLSYSPALGLFTDALEYHTATLDARRYWDLTHGYTFAGRTLLGFSDGRDPQIFSVGGYSTLRGFRDFDLLGSRIALVNTEIRFPFIQQLGVVGPVPVGVFNLRGAVFADAGLVWNRSEPLRWEPIKPYLGADNQNGYGVGFGVGIRTFLLFALLKVDTAWSTNFHDVSRPRWHVSLGPEF